ncbi:hypothetical protein ACQZ6X_002331 [Escherichia coli]|jgi:hypothetical protein|uniref:hypothetical protein n=1 Tax=Escherichia coli TaxID=562 RepID=UPI0022C3BCB4|nr:hypothetical protein [Escherichia coli]MCZ5642370.1 hypothetical protein [Escherichia coli]MEB7176788.1 hypothetical protein [Escherichia coli]
MSNIDKQAHKMRNYLNTAVISGMKLLHLTTDELSALLDELEAKDRKILKLEKLAEAESVGADKAATSGVEWMKLYHAAEKRIAELEARAFNPAILDVIAERQRQQSVEGWMPEHDDEHCNGELAMAAVCYINETGTVNRNGGKPWGWPWDASWWKPNARRRNLVKAGALILAEIERIDRAAGIGKGE